MQFESMILTTEGSNLLASTTSSDSIVFTNFVVSGQNIAGLSTAEKQALTSLSSVIQTVPVLAADSTSKNGKQVFSVSTEVSPTSGGYYRALGLYAKKRCEDGTFGEEILFGVSATSATADYITVPALEGAIKIRFTVNIDYEVYSGTPIAVVYDSGYVNTQVYSSKIKSIEEEIKGMKPYYDNPDDASLHASDGHIFKLKSPVSTRNVSVPGYSDVTHQDAIAWGSSRYLKSRVLDGQITLSHGALEYPACELWNQWINVNADITLPNSTLINVYGTYQFLSTNIGSAIASKHAGYSFVECSRLRNPGYWVEFNKLGTNAVLCVAITVKSRMSASAGATTTFTDNVVMSFNSNGVVSIKVLIKSSNTSEDTIIESNIGVIRRKVTTDGTETLSLISESEVCSDTFPRMYPNFKKTFINTDGSGLEYPIDIDSLFMVGNDPCGILYISQTNEYLVVPYSDSECAQPTSVHSYSYTIGQTIVDRTRTYLTGFDITSYIVDPSTAQNYSVVGAGSGFIILRCQPRNGDTYSDLLIITPGETYPFADYDLMQIPAYLEEGVSSSLASISFIDKFGSGMCIGEISGSEEALGVLGVNNKFSIHGCTKDVLVLDPHGFRTTVSKYLMWNPKTYVNLYKVEDNLDYTYSMSSCQYFPDGMKVRLFNGKLIPHFG